ncbi:hypothetical protein yc1106_00251 [Curvularia clavata]|uniref:Uncharacterized protein n=1 Tax=Curvularia clavata TaxID=95742 RepID=A0A9Q8YZS7_CURCL|nr:hypothetical protein yc1106_00251 [Curvularia clavata]
MARLQRTQQQPGTYTYEQLPGLMVAADEALFPQLFAAADFVAQMLQANGIPYAFMGGFALKLRGSTRDTHDVDVTVECTMLRLIEVLSGQPRILRPAGPTPGVMRVFVLVGGQFDPGVPELWVVVDMIIGGSLGAPDHPQTSLEVVDYNTDMVQKQFPVIDLLSSMASKLGAFYSRQGPNDYRDLTFLITKYPEQVFAIRNQLNATQRQYFVAAFARTNTDNAIIRVKHALGIV